MIADYRKFKQPIPEELNAPELYDVEISLWRSFWDLSTERAGNGMGEGRIRWSAIHRYAETSGIDAKSFEAIIKAMDEAYLAHKAGEPEGKPVFSREMFKR